MSLEVDYLPIATAGGANVDSQADFVGSGYQTLGFQAGLAQSKQLNKAWRQSSMMAAALANFISEVLGINVLDDGNISALITNLTNAILAAGLIGVNSTPITVNAAVTTPQNLMSFTLPAGLLNRVNKAIRITASGTIQVGVASEGGTIQCTAVSGGALGTAALLTINTGGTPMSSPIGWSLIWHIITISTGVSGSVVISPRFTLDVLPSISGLAVVDVGQVAIPVVGVDLTAAITGQFFGQANSGSALNIFSQKQLIVEALN